MSSIGACSERSLKGRLYDAQGARLPKARRAPVHRERDPDGVTRRGRAGPGRTCAAADATRGVRRLLTRSRRPWPTSVLIARNIQQRAAPLACLACPTSPRSRTELTIVSTMLTRWRGQRGAGDRAVRRSGPTARSYGGDRQRADPDRTTVGDRALRAFTVRCCGRPRVGRVHALLDGVASGERIRRSSRDSWTVGQRPDDPSHSGPCMRCRPAHRHWRRRCGRKTRKSACSRMAFLSCLPDA